MENPRIRRLRRHTSIFPRVQSSSLSDTKSNPYIGWFRHAPSTKFNKKSIYDRLQWEMKSSRMKKSPYVGWFCHSPSSQSRLKKYLFDKFEDDLKTLLAIEERKQRKMLNDGKLRGGTTSWFEPSTSVGRMLGEVSVASQRSTIRAVTRLTAWLNQKSCVGEDTFTKKYCDLLLSYPASNVAAPAETDDDCSTDGDDDSDTSSALTPGSQNSQQRYLAVDPGISITNDLSVSSLAAAYYAHQASEDFDIALREEFRLSEYENNERLDHVITQIDITRMAKNASRHLDVESILSLPIVTYHKENTEDQADEGQETGSSWMIIPSIEHDVQKAGQMCVICRENFQEGDRLRVLPCCHSFHVGCIDRWLSGSRSFDDCDTSGCPICKKRPEKTEDESCGTNCHSGVVPSWAFASVGISLANSDNFSSTR